MKIGILSMQRVRNYGSMLQAYSLKKMIEEIAGCEARFIDPTYVDLYPANMPIVDSDDYEGGSDYKVNAVLNFIIRARNHFVNKEFYKEIAKFQQEYLKVNPDYRNDTYDLVIEGSDEVFKCTTEVFRDLYGANKNGKKLVTYAAACGSADVSGFDDNTLSLVRQDMANFSAMSVRDEHTRDFVSTLYDGPIEMHMDPVLMGDLAKRRHDSVNEKKYMIVYGYSYRIKNKDEVEEIKAFAKRHGLMTIAVGAPQLWCDRYIAVSPFRLLDYFHNASFVVTDTFHGTIFSIINHVKFATLIRTTNRNKLSALLEQLGLNERILDRMSDLESVLTKDIDYTKVDDIIDSQRKLTRNYLKEQIDNAREN